MIENTPLRARPKDSKDDDIQEEQVLKQSADNNNSTEKRNKIQSPKTPAVINNIFIINL